MRLYLFFTCCLAAIFYHTGMAQQGTKEVFLTGRILEETGAPLSLATVSVEGYSIYTLSNQQGDFRLKIPHYITNFKIRITAVGKKSVEEEMTTKALPKGLVIRMKDNTLTLDSLTITSTFGRTNNSISSIIFDEEAIDRIQAFSLMDVLNTLPGKQLSAPNINTPQTLTLRNTLGGVHDLNNSLGIPIIMDGVTLSNDANMQSRPITQWSMGSGALPATNNGNTGDVPFRGIDLRSIPVESIEKIEVIQGVASPEYGEMTDGVVLIERKAGKSPMQITVNANATAYNYSLNKGFNLPKGLGGISIDANYALSNKDPKNNFQEYRRYGVGIRWNTNPGKVFRNKLSFDYNSKIDEGKLDPDDKERLKYYSSDKGIRISNTLYVAIPHSIVDNISLMTSVSIAKQDSYAQRMLNQGIKMFANKDTTGIYEGTVINAQYLSVEEIVGKPVTASFNLKLSSNFSQGDMRHMVTYGVNGNYNNNGGKGIISDPDLPRFMNINNQNSRPYSFQLTPDVINYGLYVSDNMQYSLWGKRWTSSVGFRVDSQNESWSFQPRLNTQVMLSNKVNIGAAYGLSTKSPTLAQIYPTPAWLDIPLITAIGKYNTVYLVYTEKMITTNKGLKPMQNSQAELNVNYNQKRFSMRLNAFYKDFKNGFNSKKVYTPITVPVYSYKDDPDLQKIVYTPTGELKTYNDISYNIIDNTKNSYTYGFDWSLSIHTIKGINTSISTSTSYIISKENNGNVYEEFALKTPVSHNNQNIWYVLYEPLTKNKRHILTSKLNTITHIPKIGFVVMTNTDFFWQNKMRSMYDTPYQPAVGYLDANMKAVYIGEENDIGLPRRSISLNMINQPIVYANFSMSVAKEISRKIRIAITTYNTFNIMPHYSFQENGIEKINVFNSPLSITGGITIKL